MIDSVAGIMNAAPMPWTARLATSAAVVRREAGRRGGEREQTTPNRNARRRPKMSPSRPPVTSSTANVSV